MRCSVLARIVLFVALVLVGASCASAGSPAPSDGEAAAASPEASADTTETAAEDSSPNVDAAAEAETATSGDSEVSAASDAQDAQEAEDVAEPEASTVNPCPFAADASTAGVLTSLADDLRDSGDAELAERVGDLAAGFDGDNPTAETLVTLMTLLPEANVALADRTGVGCLETLQSALGRLGGLVTAEGSASAIALASADEDLESIIQRGFRLPAEDAFCVAEQLGDVSENIEDIDDVDVLIALSACSNNS